MALPEEQPRHGYRGRSSDRLKGFFHLESFDELRQWTKDVIDPLQRSNTPLLLRPDATSSSVRSGKSKIMLIHDYIGGYADYEACQGAEVEQEMYSCDYLQYVESFVYFSHRLVTVPPPTWTNTCHRNGVKVLGTFIVEPGAVGVEQILDSRHGRFWVADQLVQIAKVCGFDGWLINIETNFDLQYWNVQLLEGFLTQLKAGLGTGSQVVWYDALTALNVVWYQNTLNAFNLRFARAAGSILTNYAWSPDEAEKARFLAEESGLGRENVYFGIDVWAQNIQRGGNRRVTWPVNGGGGTGTGMGVKALASLGLNAGVFAPGWSFEHFKEKHRAIERAIWLGEKLPKGLICDCNPHTPHQHVPYQQYPIVESAHEYPSGSSSFYHIDFSQIFSKSTECKAPYYSHLGRQSVSPNTTTAKLLQRSFFGKGVDRSAGVVTLEQHDSPARCAIVASMKPNHSHKGLACGQLLIARLGIEPTAAQLEAIIVYRAVKTRDFSASLLFYDRGLPKNVLLGDTEGEVVTKRVQIDRMTSIHSIMLDVVCGNISGYNSDVLELAELFSITIQPCTRMSCQIDDVWIEKREGGDIDHERLVWSITPDPSKERSQETELPFSHITGPFAYFRVCVDDRDIGNAYALEFVLPTNIRNDKDKAEISVIGIAFDGTEAARCRKTLTLRDDWVFAGMDE